MHDGSGGMYPCMIEVGGVYPCMIEVEVCIHA